MKKIINGLAYNTDTAKEIDSYCNELPMSDFCYLEETLYQNAIWDGSIIKLNY